MTNRPPGTPTPMDVFEAVRTLLAVRSYRDTPVPDAVVRRIIEAGRLTGSGMNRQPWHFIVVRDRDTLRRLGALAPSGPYVAEAPLAIVVAIDKTRFAVSDASRAIQSMLLAARADGVGSNWVGFGGLEEVKPLLDIPAKLEVLAILPFGYPARPVGRGKWPSEAARSTTSCAERSRRNIRASSSPSTSRVKSSSLETRRRLPTGQLGKLEWKAPSISCGSVAVECTVRLAPHGADARLVRYSGLSLYRDRDLSRRAT